MFIDYGLNVPRRTSLVSLVRLSRDMARAMNLATVMKGKSMQCEAWPVTVALHSQLRPSSDQTFDTELAALLSDIFPLKAVYVPHPVYLGKQWSTDQLDDIVNGPSFLGNDYLMQDSSFMWTSQYSHKLYDNWRQRKGVDACRSPALVHPVKKVGY